MVVADPGKAILLNGDRLEGGKRVISSVKTGISFGDLIYSFEFTQLSEVRYREQLKILRERKGYLVEGPPDFLDATPSDKQYEYCGYRIQAPYAVGAHGVVCPATRLSTGAMVAVKRIKRTAASIDAVRLEVEVYKKIAGHSNVCNLVEVIYSDGDSSSTGPSQINDVYLIHEPLARETFVQLILSKPDLSLRMNAFFQISNGLCHLHSCGIMHRDIKPSNLMVATYQPLRVVIIDYGHATSEDRSTDHYKGSIPYLAPEVLALKRQMTSAPYERSCDVWSLGLSGYQLFLGKHCGWGPFINDASHISILEQLGEQKSQIPACEVLQKMLAWEPGDRLSISEVIANPIWEDQNKAQLDKPQ